jgi:YHS domain-containing protein
MGAKVKEPGGNSHNQTDPICGMQVPADSPHAVEDCHRRIVFCSQHCLERYLKMAPDVDPTCGMHVPASSPYVLKEDNRLIRFCSVDCRAVYQQRQR